MVKGEDCCLLITRIVNSGMIQWHGILLRRENKNRLKIGKYPLHMVTITNFLNHEKKNLQPNKYENIFTKSLFILKTKVVGGY